MKIDTIRLHAQAERGAEAHPANPARRAVLGALLAGAAVAGAWTPASAAAALQAAGAAARPHNAGFTQPELKILTVAADAIVPVTDTPGAVAAGVPHFIDALAKAWMTPEELAQFRAGLADLDKRAQQRYRRGFAACTPAQATEILQALRASSPYDGHTFELAARIEDPQAPFYLRLRDLVVYGYFTSEVGSTKELRYVAVPGRFDGDVDIKTWPYQNVI
ncbi:gluconate 2-dehydrogenase subunit 3 family protein [Massilia luteola]|uniref:gluconate 2-dehydrogenase subunit 3 family protein n=1 Tax=Massilia luteola TaxID=3081751 RepID=UPI002ACC010E|nr:gluconate 2-dehydrogenase subunit 3 family protein [Massilia sp. Gc5]